MNTGNKVKLSLVIFVAVGLLMVASVISPILKTINDNSVELHFKKQDVAYLDNKLGTIDDFKQNYTEIKYNLEKGESLFAVSEAPVNFIGFLEDISEGTNVDMDIFPSGLAQSPEDPWPSMIFKIRTVSAFEGLLEFIEKLEVGPYLVQVRNLSIIRLTSEELQVLVNNSLGDVRGELSVKVFADKTSEL